MKTIALLLLAANSWADIKPISQGSTQSSLTIPAGSGTCFSADSPSLVVDCDNNRVGFGDSTPDGQAEILSAAAATGFVLAVSSQNDTTGNIMAITGNGRVGIGQPAPAQKLHLSSGTVYVDGTGAAIVFGAAASAKVAGRLYSSAVTTFTAAAAGEIALYNYTLPANTLAAAADSIFVTCFSTQASDSWTKNNGIRFAGTLITPANVSATSTDFRTSATVFYQSSGYMRSYSDRQRDATWNNGFTTTAWNPTIANAISCVGIGNGVAHDVEGMSMTVDFRPAP